MWRQVSKTQDIRTDGRDNGGKDHCHGSRYCLNETHQVVVFDNNGIECRWPVCPKHARPFFFNHLGVPFRFEPKEQPAPQASKADAQAKAYRIAAEWLQANLMAGAVTGETEAEELAVTEQLETIIARLRAKAAA